MILILSQIEVKVNNMVNLTGMNFLRTIQNSIYSPKFYLVILKKSFKASLGYFLLLALLLTIIHLITLINPLFVTAPKKIQEFAGNLVNCYPKDLEINIKSGQASVSATEPYFIKSCEGDKSQNLVVIDTKTPFSQTQFDKYKTLAWVSKDSVIFHKNDLETRTYSLNKMKDITLNKTVLDSFIQTLNPYLKFVGPILLFFSLIGIYLSYIFRLIYLLLLSSLIWLLGKLFKYNLGYIQAYKLGLHAITLGLFVELLVDLTAHWTGFYGFPFMVSIFTLAAVMVNLFLPKKST